MAEPPTQAEDDMNPSPQSDRDALLKLLEGLRDPQSGKGLVSAGLVQGLSVRNGRVGFMMEAPGGLLYEKIEGMALMDDGDVYVCNDNDGVDDNSGETQLLNVGGIL